MESTFATSFWNGFGFAAGMVAALGGTFFILTSSLTTNKLKNKEESNSIELTDFNHQEVQYEQETQEQGSQNEVQTNEKEIQSELEIQEQETQFQRHENVFKKIFDKLE